MESTSVTISVGLKNWITLQSLHEHRSSHQAEAINNSAQFYDGRNESRLFYTKRVIRLILLLIDLLVNDEEHGSEETFPCSDDIQDTIHIEDVLSVENFVVTVTVYERQRIPLSQSNHEGTTDDQFIDGILSSALVRPEWARRHVGLQSIAEGVTTVGFVSSLSTKKFINGPVSNLVYEKLGLLLYQLFSRGIDLPTNASKNEDLKSVLISPKEKNSSKGSPYKAPIHDCDSTSNEEAEEVETGRLAQTNLSFKKMAISDRCESILLGYGVPESICRLVSDLMKQGNDRIGNPFFSLNDVVQELTQIVENPRVFLQSSHERTLSMRQQIDFGNCMFGRREELERLQNVAMNVVNEMIAADGQDLPPVRLALVGGAPGSGKSFLIENLEEPLKESDWLCLKSKFDRLRNCQPLSIISSAFDKFFASIASATNTDEEMLDEEDEEQIEAAEIGNDIKSSISRSLSSSAIADLSKLMPSLGGLFPTVIRRVVSDPDLSSLGEGGENSNVDEATSDAEMATARLHFLFYTLLRALSNPERPLLFFLDDLQWADKSSLDLMSSLLLDFNHLQQFGNDVDTAPCVFFVAAYRSNELDGSHILTSYFEKFEQSNALEITRIVLSDLPKEEINDMVSTTLGLPGRLTRSLTEVLHGKTLGNPLFVKAFMKSLVERKTLRYSLLEKRWIWDIVQIQVTAIDESIAELLARNLLDLPTRVQEALKVTSCFGSRINEGLLILLSAGEKFGHLLNDLRHAMDENIIEKHGDTFVFSHELLHEATYELMERAECGQYHYSIGTQLISTHTSLKESEMNPIHLVAIDQINTANLFGVTDPSLCTVFSSLNLEAAHRSTELSDFISALNYCELGISYLDHIEARWESEYELMLRLHQAACVACYASGMPEKTSKFIEELLDHAKCLEDRLKSYYVLVQSLVSLGEMKDAIDRAFLVIRDLGYNFPAEPTPGMIESEIVASSALLKDVSIDDVLAAPKMTDTRNLWAMKFLNISLTSVYVAHPTLLPLVASKMVKISAEHGYCSDSAAGITTHGYLLISIFQDIEEGYRLGKIGLSLIESFNVKATIPRLTYLVTSYIKFWVEPLQATASTLLQTNRDALLVGDVVTSAMSGLFYCRERLMCGADLHVQEKECSAVAFSFIQSKQVHFLFLHCSHHLVVLKLIGSDKNPFDEVNGAIKNEDDFFLLAVTRGSHSAAQVVCFNRLFLAYWFKQYPKAVEMAEQYREFPPGMRFYDAHHAFYEGLTAFQMARSSENVYHWLDIGQKDLLAFQNWTKHSTWNFESKFFLLEAEYHFTLGQIEVAEQKYIASIESARRHHFIHEEGLALSLLSAFYSQLGSIEKARQQNLEARGCFEKWGAFGLLRILEAENEGCLNMN